MKLSIRLSKIANRPEPEWDDSPEGGLAEELFYEKMYEDIVNAIEKAEITERRKGYYEGQFSFMYNRSLYLDQIASELSNYAENCGD